MSSSMNRLSLAVATGRLNRWARGWLVPALLRRRTFGVAFVVSALAAVYWGFIASDRYVSEAHVIIQRTDMSSGASMDFSGLLGSMGGNAGADQLLLRNHLLSVDMLKKLDARLDLRSHYSDWRRDPLSRMWFKDAPVETFFEYYLARISVDYDSYDGVLVIKAGAFDPKTANAIASMLVEEGEHYMNVIAHRLADDQVAFLEKQTADMGERAMQARKAVLAFQNKRGMVSPQTTAENVAGIVSTLQAQLSDLQTRRNAMLGYLMPTSANVVELNMQISAIEKQIAKENARLTSSNNKALNETVEEFQRLQMNADFAQDLYKSALLALERGRIDATRTLKKVSVIQSPTLPEYPIEPRRLYNVVVFSLMALLVAGIIHLVAAIIRDHRD